MSRIRYPITCPTCGALPNQHCHATKTGGTTDTHKARVVADDLRRADELWRRRGWGHQ